VSEENENKDEDKDEDEETLSLQASEVKEKEPSATEGRPLNTNVEQVHMELGERKTDTRMGEMEKENRR
jgi:hypothetical protein